MSAASLKIIYKELYEKGFLKTDFMSKGQIPELCVLDKDYQNLNNKIRGCIIGGAVGDAIGRDAERITPPTDIDITEYKKWHGWQNGPTGTVTDDTQMTMWVAESLIENDGLNPDDLAKRFTSEYIRAAGRGTIDFIKNIKVKKLEWYKAGSKSTGNGAAMRVAPVGIFFAHNCELLKLAAGLQSMITHNDSMAIASGIAVAFAVSMLLRMNSNDIAELESKIKFCNDIADVIEGIEENNYRTRNSDEIDRMHNRIKNKIPMFLKEQKHPEEINEIFWSGAYVLETLPFAIYCFLYTPGDFKKILYNSVNYSRDSDTIASICCQLWGALNGIKSIPEYYISELEYKDRLLNISDEITKKLMKE